MDGDFILEKAMTFGSQKQFTSKKVFFVETTHSKSQLIVKTSRRPDKKRQVLIKGESGQSRQTICSKCGKSPNHGNEVFPEKDAICRKCGKKGHFHG